MKNSRLAVLLTAVLACSSRPPAPLATRDEVLQAELLAMYAADQNAREGFGVAAAANDTLYGKRMIALDSAHTRRLKEIVNARGWPGRSMVGDDGAHAAWALVQHSPDLDFQAEILVLLSRPQYRGEVASSELAMLTDRVLTKHGKPQLYGTQFDIVDGALVLSPITDEANVDARRIAVGLPPMAEYIRQMEQMTGLKLKRF